MRQQDSLSAAVEGYLAIMYGCYPDAGPFGAETWWSGTQDTLQGSNPGQAECERPVFLYSCSQHTLDPQASSSLSAFSWCFWAWWVCPQGDLLLKTKSDTDPSYSGSLTHYSQHIEATSFMPLLQSTFISAISFDSPNKLTRDVGQAILIPLDTQQGQKLFLKSLSCGWQHGLTRYSSLWNPGWCYDRFTDS